MRLWLPKGRGGGQLGSTDIHPRKKRGSKAQTDPLNINVENPCHEIISNYNYVNESVLDDAWMFEMIPEDKEISMDYERAYELMERSSIYINDIFTYTIAQEIIEHDDVELRSVAEC